MRMRSFVRSVLRSTFILAHAPVRSDDAGTKSPSSLHPTPTPKRLRALHPCTTRQQHQPPQHKLSQPIAVSGRMTRTATKVKPRLEFSGRAAAAGGGGAGAGAGGVASPTAGRAKRNAGTPGSANRRLHKSPRTSIDRGERASRLAGS